MTHPSLSSASLVAALDRQGSAVPMATDGLSIRSHQAETMKAVVVEGYGGPEVLRVGDVPIPDPAPDEILVRVMAANVTAADAMMRRGVPRFARLFLGLRRPKRPVPGTGFAGVVVAVGSAVTRFCEGDEVFGEAGMNFGAQAEFVRVAESGVVVRKPDELSFGDAAVLCDGPVTSHNFLSRMAEVRPGQRVLINGAAGSLGSAAVQLAKRFGAVVTGVCSSSNEDLVRSLGADAVIDYTETDFTRNGEVYDVIYDCVGKSSFWRSRKSLARDGKYLSPVLNLGLLFQVVRTKCLGRRRALFDATGLRAPTELRDVVEGLSTMVVEGSLRIVTGHVCGLEDIAEAYKLVDSGHKIGNLVVRL